MDKYDYLQNADIEVIENLYQEYLNHPESVDESWKKFFEGFDNIGDTLFVYSKQEKEIT